MRPAATTWPFEAALLLRIVQVPPEQRVLLTEKREAREKVVAQVEKMFKGSIGLAQARKAGLLLRRADAAAALHRPGPVG